MKNELGPEEKLIFYSILNRVILPIFALVAITQVAAVGDGKPDIRIVDTDAAGGCFTINHIHVVETGQRNVVQIPIFNGNKAPVTYGDLSKALPVSHRSVAFLADLCIVDVRRPKEKFKELVDFYDRTLFHGTAPSLIWYFPMLKVLEIHYNVQINGEKIGVVLRAPARFHSAKRFSSIPFEIVNDEKKIIRWSIRVGASTDSEHIIKTFGL